MSHYLFRIEMATILSPKQVMSNGIDQSFWMDRPDWRASDSDVTPLDQDGKVDFKFSVRKAAMEDVRRTKFTFSFLDRQDGWIGSAGWYPLCWSVVS